MKKLPKHFAELSAKDFPPIPIRKEIRLNLARQIRERKTLFPGIVGFEETVVPQIVNALLAEHDMILLGLRGQAKTRLCRMLVNFLDEWRPVVPGCPLNSHPLRPLTAFAKAEVAKGDDLPIAWLNREERYQEKLATPDVTMADLIGDIDPLKAAHRKLDLSDPEVIHYGIIPRSNHGIFAINELPDLAPRIQVGLLNILEERDMQVRGFPLRIPLDLLLVFTANPEDYTNRGSIITPLKDRIASQIHTHYPRTMDDAIEISAAEAWTDRDGDLPKVEVPRLLLEIIEEIAFQGRGSEFVDQASGVSARLPIAVRELLLSQVEQRVLRNGKGVAPVPRLIDLSQTIPAITGKVELVYEGEQEGALKVARHLLGNACRAFFDRSFPSPFEGEGGKKNKSEEYESTLAWFAKGNRLELSDQNSDEEHAKSLESVPGLAALVKRHLPDLPADSRPAAMEVVLEGLHQHSLLAREEAGRGLAYSDMLGNMMKDL